jgi:hypothetical protein
VLLPVIIRNDSFIFITWNIQYSDAPILNSTKKEKPNQSFILQSYIASIFRDDVMHEEFFA